MDALQQVDAETFFGCCKNAKPYFIPSGWLASQHDDDDDSDVIAESFATNLEFSAATKLWLRLFIPPWLTKMLSKCIRMPKLA